MNHIPQHEFRIIDALGPFCISRQTLDSSNWSKVPFVTLEKNNRLPQSVRSEIVQRFETYLHTVQSLGYDSLSIDDLAHLVIHPFYTPELRTLLEDYQQLYSQLFAIAKKESARIFINTDYLFYNDEIKTHLNHTQLHPSDFFLQTLEIAFQTFPEIDGIILRIGEHDGKDVKGNFLSHLTLRTPKQANALLKKILPLFEAQNKQLIFRTWTVGVYPIGDLIWNKHTFDAVFSSISSTALIISMKSGDTDFMRYLSLNPLFFHGTHKKIIELQTRREWEGMGIYPSFVGWEYAHYFERLAQLKTFIGIHVWCQTGGWAKASWNNTTYLENSSFWNELNTEVTIQLYEGVDVPAAVATFCEKRNILQVDNFLHLLELSDIAIKNGLYIPEIAEQTLYLRRTRLPTLLWIRWDTLMLQPTFATLLRMLITRPHAAYSASERAVKAIEAMQKIAQNISLSHEVQASLVFQNATFRLFARLRFYMTGMAKRKDVVELNKAIQIYTATYPQHYTIPKLRTFRRRIIPKRSTRVFLRNANTYRKRDRVMLSTSPVQRMIVRYYLRLSQSDLLDQSMGIDILFK